jgi:hypothetical protein
LSLSALLLVRLNKTRYPRLKFKSIAPFTLLLVAVLAACSVGGGGGTNPPPSIRVTVSPGTANVFVNQLQTFTAAVSNATNNAVTWSVSGSGCSGASCGSIDGSGLYTAPATVPNPATVTVTATSQQDTTKSGNATVTVQQNTQSATYTITVTASDGTLSYSTNVTLTVN